MMSTLETAERVFAAAKQLRDEHRKFQRIKDRYPHSGTPKQKQKAATDLDWQAHHIVKIEHALHAACVDAGLADAREPEHYRPYTVKLTGFHEYEVVPPVPASLATGGAA